MAKENRYFQLKLCVITPKILLSNLGGVRILNYLRYLKKQNNKLWEFNIMAMEKKVTWGLTYFDQLCNQLVVQLMSSQFSM